MILRPLSNAGSSSPEQDGPRPASTVFLEREKHITAPYAVVFQREHSQLAGELASALREDIFGELTPDVIGAAGQHDFGWDPSDLSQIESLPQGKLRPFPDLSVGETLPSWRNSLAHAASVSPLVEVLVSRHFCLLGSGDPGRQDFVNRETERRSKLESTLPFTAADLDRWADAVGFSDLLSLYLCSGCQESVQFPLAHPASPKASEAPKVTLLWRSGSPAFSSPVLKPGTQVSMTVRTYSGEGADLPRQTFSWTFIDG
jgi:Protein of unknown function (DUF3891)